MGHVQSNSLTQEYCMSLSDTYKTECMRKISTIEEEVLSEQAINGNNMNICEKIANIELKNNCRDTINLKLAIRTKTSDTCSDITGEKDQLYCRSQLSKIDDITNYKNAMRNQDITMCKKIVDPRVQSDCHDKILLSTIKITKDISLCVSLTNTRLISPCQQIAQ